MESSFRMKHLEAFAELAETCEKIIKKAEVDDAMKAFKDRKSVV